MASTPPADYSIIGFDDSPYTDIMDLTTTRQNPYSMGACAATKTLALIEGRALEKPHEIAGTQLLLRDSDSLYAAQRKTTRATRA